MIADRDPVINSNVKERGIDPSIHHKVRALSGNLNPFCDKIASQRLNMATGTIPHSLALNHPEIPDVSSGYELLFGDYYYSTFRPTVDVEIIEVIPKFRKLPIHLCPKFTIIYQELDSGIYSCADIYKYNVSYENYGFHNEIDFTRLTPGTIIRAKEEVVHPRSKDPINQTYSTGVNANVAFLSILDTYEDSFVASDRLLKKLGVTLVRTVEFYIRPDEYPVDFRYDPDNPNSEVKIIPDIGEQIDQDGILTALRKIDPIMMTLDYNIDESRRLNIFHDKITQGYPGATIIDVDVFIKPRFTHLTKSFDQLYKYREDILDYHYSIYKVYERKIGHAGKISPILNSYITDSISIVIVNEQSKNKRKTKDISKYERKSRPIKIPSFRSTNLNYSIKNSDTGKMEEVNIYLKVTYTYEVTPFNGFKINGREGGKGVICKALHEMPVDEDGVHVDLVMDPAAIIKRTIMSLPYEQFIGRGNKLIQKRIQTLPLKEQYELIIQYLRDVNPEWGDIVDQTYKNNPQQLVNEVLEDGIKVVIEPSSRHINTQFVLNMSDKYNIKPKKLRYPVTNNEGKIKRWVEFKNPVFVGSRYVCLMYNLPNVNAVADAYINQFDLPTKNVKPSIRRKGEISISPLRMGEDELRMLLSTCDGDTITRFKHLRSYSRKGLERLITGLLTVEEPGAYEKTDISDQELRDTSTILQSHHSFMELSGIEFYKHKIK